MGTMGDMNVFKGHPAGIVCTGLLQDGGDIHAYTEPRPAT